MNEIQAIMDKNDTDVTEEETSNTEREAKPWRLLLKEAIPGATTPKHEA